MIFGLGIVFSSSPDATKRLSDETLEKFSPISLQELGTAVERATPGDTIFIKNGAYKDVEVILTKKPKTRVYIMPETPGGVSITGKSTITIDKSTNITLQNFFFDVVTNPSAVILNSSSDIEIYNNYFYKCGVSRFGFIVRLDRGSFANKIHRNTFDSSHAMSVVIALRPTNLHTKDNKNNEIFNNLFCNIPQVESIYPDSDGNGLEAIQLGQGVKGTEQWELETKIYNNLFENIIGDRAEIISNKSSKNYIYNNTFLDNNSGITIRGGNDVEIVGNYLRNTTRGVRLYGSGHLIKNNYIERAILGIQIPSADYDKSQALLSERPGIYQQIENSIISGNVIVNPSRQAVLIGAGDRKLQPRNIKFERNRSVVTARGSEDFAISPNTPTENLSFRRNRTYRAKELGLGERAGISAKARLPQLGTLSSRSAKRLQEGNDKDIRKITGMVPFQSFDERTGATWRRP